MQTRAEFLAERRTGIGSSDAAALFSLGYGCARRLVLQKRGAQPDYEPPDKNVFRRGIALEPIVAQEYADATKRTLSTCAVMRHPEHPELLVHADRLILKSEEHSEVAGVLELKTAGREIFKKLQREGMQDDHTLQVQWALMVTGLTWGSYAVLWADGWEQIHFDIEPNHELIAEMIAQGLETWAMVENGPLPNRLEPDDKRCLSCEFRMQCQGQAMLDLLGDDAKKASFDESINPVLDEYLAAQEILKNAEEIHDQAKGQLEDAIGDRILVETIGGRVTFKPHKRSSVNSEKLKKTYPDIFEVCRKETVVRPLRVYPKAKP